MARYLNPDVGKFKASLNSEIYVDKSNLIMETNALFNTEQRFICLSRPRRFGKTMAANMLAAYYGLGLNTHDLFKDLKIAQHPSYSTHLNQHNVLMINMQTFLSKSETVDGMLRLLQENVIKEMVKVYPDIDYEDKSDLTEVMTDIYFETGKQFVILVDEWDCLFREYKNDFDSQKVYLDFLRLWLKDQVYIGLAYMTGILPIKKYGSHSAVNMFEEYSMIEPSQFLAYFGFSESEVKVLADDYQVDFGEIRKWYNGYFIDLGSPMYNPKSVTSSLMRKSFSSFWNKTETYEALKDYIMLDFDGLKEKITLMLTGAKISLDTRSFTNDMTTFNHASDVLTLLVHLGYLSYNFKEKTVRIPNEEVKGEFVTSINALAWKNVVEALKDSDKLLQAIWEKETEMVADGIQKVHELNTSILTYNDENSLSCIISLALYSANNYYTVIREFPTGKGYADLVYLPRKKHNNKPAIIVELKWDKNVEGAISQIKQKNYMQALEEYQGNLLLVGINYNKAEKSYSCMIEEVEV